MSNITQPNFKNQVHKATPNDDLYLMPGRYTCPFCKDKPGPEKIHKHLWALIQHTSYHHTQKGGLEQ